MLDPDAIKQPINSRIEHILHMTSTGERIPFVCLADDESWKPSEVETISLSSL